MKSTVPSTFSPVHLILETQEEVDAIYAVLNHAELKDAIGLCDDAYLALDGRHNADNTDEIQRKIEALIHPPKKKTKK